MNTLQLLWPVCLSSRAWQSQHSVVLSDRREYVRQNEGQITLYDSAVGYSLMVIPIVTSGTWCVIASAGGWTAHSVLEGTPGLDADQLSRLSLSKLTCSEFEIYRS